MQMKTAFVLPLLVFLLAGLEQAQAQTAALDTTTFVVVGEGLAAGMANFGLSSVVQKQSFPARIAAQMNTGFEQPLIQPPGIGDVVGYPGQEVVVQKYPQGSVRDFYLPTDKTKAPIATPPLLLNNLSVPGQTLTDCFNLKPVAPVVQRGNSKQTVFNMLLGFPQLILDNVPLWTQLEYAEAMFPTVALIELGYYEALDAAVAGDPSRLPNPATFGTNYGTVIARLRRLQAQVIVTTIPNPLDTGYFNSPTATAAITLAAPFVINVGYHVTPQDYITRNGILEIGKQFLNNAIGPLPAGSVMTAAVAADLTARINALNAQIASAAQANGAVLYDLNAFLHKIKVSGARAGNTTITADYMGEFYSLDGVYPGATGHALIANDILNFINQTYHRSFPMVNLTSVAANDPNLSNLRPHGELRTAESLGISEQGGDQ